MAEYRPDRNGPHRVAFEKNKKILLKTRNVCGICGQPVDKSLRYPHPLSPVIDHIIPIIHQTSTTYSLLTGNAIDRSLTSFMLMTGQLAHQSLVIEIYLKALIGKNIKVDRG